MSYTDENGDSHTGPTAARDLRDAKNEWAGPIDQAMITRAIDVNQQIISSEDYNSTDIQRQNAAYHDTQGYATIRSLIAQTYGGFNEYDYYRLDTLTPDETGQLYDLRVQNLKEWLARPDISFSSAEADFLVNQYEAMETPLYYEYNDGWDTLIYYAPTLVMFLLFVIIFLVSGIFPSEHRLKANAIFFSSKLGRGKAVRAKLLSGLVTTTVIYWAAIAVYTVAGLALLGAVTLRWIMPDVPPATAYTVYGLNVVSTLCSYFLITRRLMYTCTQQGYRCTQIDFCCNVLTSLAKIAVSLWFANYVLYFSVTIFFNVMANLLIARRFKKDFPYVHDVKVTVNDFKELGIFHDLRYFLVHRLSNTIYGSSDTIVTSRMGGSTQTTFLGNYNTISTSATDLGNKVMDSFAAAIGNIVYDKSAAANDHDKQVFWGMDLFSYLFASFVATAYFCLFQPFMASWMGEQWLLPLGFVLVFCLNEYVAGTTGCSAATAPSSAILRMTSGLWSRPQR